LWRHWLEHISPQLENLQILLLLGFYDTKEMASATKIFNRNAYFQNIDFQLQPVNSYQAMICGNFKRQLLSPVL
jgi:hypothetical protein